MPVPSLITDLSATPAANPPTVGESLAIDYLYLQTIHAFLRQNYDSIVGVSDSTDVAEGDALVAVKRTYTGGVATTSHAVTELEQIRSRADGTTPADGTTDARAALAVVDAAAVAAGSSLVLQAGTYRVNSAITLSSRLVFQPGAVLKPASGITITLGQDFQAPIQQIFDLSLGGLVALAQGTCVVAGEWWGAKGDNVKTDNEVQINQAAAALLATAGAGTVTLQAGYFIISEEILLRNHVGLVGQGKFYTNIRANLAGFASTRYMIRAQNGTSSMFECPVRSLRLSVNGHSNIDAAIYGPAWQQRSGADGVYIEGFRVYGIWLDTGYGGATQLKLSQTEIFADPNCFSGAACIRADYSNYVVGWMSLTLEGIQCGCGLATVTFTTGLASGATSGTLSVAWAFPTGVWNVNFSNGTWRLVTLTNGATTATWAVALSAAATVTASGVSPNASGIVASGRIMLNVQDVHFEIIPNGFILQTDATVVGSMIKPSGNNDVQAVFACAGSWTGSIRANGVKRGGATALIVDSNRAEPLAALEPYDGELVWPPANDKAVCMGRITGSGTPAFAWQQGTLSMTVANQSAGVQRVTLSPGFSSTAQYDVQVMSGDNAAPQVNWAPISGTQFDVVSRDGAGTATNSSILSIKVFGRP